MANNPTIVHTIPNGVLLASVVFKFIAMVIGVLGNVTVINHTIFLNKQKTATSYLVGNLALADLLVCLALYPIWIIEFIQVIMNIDSDQDLFCKFSRSTMWAFMFASIATLLAITVDRYVYIVKPLRYPQIVTHRRVFLAVAGIWITACCVFTVHYIRGWDSKSKFRSFCVIPCSINYFNNTFAGYIPLFLIFLLNFCILSAARKQRKRVLAQRRIASIHISGERSANRRSFMVSLLVALKSANTFAIVFAVLIICTLIPAVVGPILDHFCTTRCQQIWYLLLHYELNGINSIMNAFIYGLRHVKYRKAYLHVLFKLFSCHKVTK